ncbi:cytochrome P450 [Gymnopus androsaceus JB14]|uniref:Cytochrome P450 n=1 Tax=Gymnopus androsaceus JB14 TaxID=1447944 RepID=A0A6A4HSG8_9AGAR|nr:cytochrome P450 [Gymnopus androsaceus JB14]
MYPYTLYPSLQWPLIASLHTVPFYASLLSSIVLYRLSPLHPLAKVPGPRLHKISKLWSVWICWKGRQHTEFKAMHDKYGPVVRTGPNEISVIDPTAVNAILGAGGLPKGKSWNRALNTDALDEYDEILVKNGLQLVEGMQANSHGEVDLTAWFNYFSFDFMADFVFGGGSDLLQKGRDEKGILELLDHHMITRLSHTVVFLSRNRIPGVTESTLKMRKFASEWVQNRLKMGAQMKDLWYHLTNEAEKETQPLITEVAADALLAIVAGADTTSVALTNFFWLILSNPEHYKLVQQEIDTVYGEADATDLSKHSELKYTSACLNEALRLLPPGLTGGPRQVPKGGRSISGHFLPEGTQVYVPLYVIHRNPQCFFPNTNDFVPSRWLKSEEGRIHDTKSFLAFSAGPANCVGRKLARQEMFMKFEFSFGREFDWEHWPETMRDFMTTSRGPLKVIARSK